MEGERVGMVIGDVTGKGVSGALVMSASRSVFRMLSEEERPVAANMMRANRRLKKDVKTGMFVALLYAVVDGGAARRHPVQRRADHAGVPGGGGRGGQADRDRGRHLPARAPG